MSQYLFLRDLAEEYYDLIISDDELEDFEIERKENLADLLWNFGFQINNTSDADVRQVKDSIILIPESEWETYCQDYAEDAGLIAKGSPIANYVNWKEWADSMRTDYGSIEFDGQEYYFQL